MKDLAKRSIWSALTFAAAACAISYLRSISLRYPFYFKWDMDLTIAIDRILLSSGLLPDHVNHPSFGLYFLLGITQSIADAFGVLPIVDLEYLRSSINPYAVTAMFTRFLREHSPWAALITAWFLAEGARLFCGVSRTCAFLAFVGLAIGKFMLHQVILVRSELFAVCFWSIGLFCLLAATRSARHRTSSALVVISGFFAGLAFETKIQAVFYLGTLFFLAVLLPLLVEPLPTKRLRSKDSPWFFGLDAFNLFFFSFALFAAQRLAPPPEGVATFVESSVFYQPNILSKAWVAALLALPGARLAVRRWSKAPESFPRIVTILSLLFFGFNLSTLLHFVILDDLHQGGLYFRTDFKMMFARIVDLKPPQFSLLIHDAIICAGLDSVSYVALLVSAIILVASHFLRNSLSERLLSLAALLGIALCVMLGITAGVRQYAPYDGIWASVLPRVLTLIFAGVTVMNRPGLRRWVMIPAALCFLYLGIEAFTDAPNLWTGRGYTEGFRSKKWYGRVYDYNQNFYENMIRSRLEFLETEAQIHLVTDFGRHAEEMYSVANFVIPDAAIGMAQVGPFFIGAPVRSDDRLAFVLDAKSPVPGDAIVVDLTGLKKTKIFFRQDLNVAVLATVSPELENCDYVRSHVELDIGFHASRFGTKAGEKLVGKQIEGDCDVTFSEEEPGKTQLAIITFH